MYLIATVELSYAGVPKFFAVAPKLRAVMEANGVQMRHSLSHDTGRLNTVVHIWEFPEVGTYYRAVDALTHHENFPEILAAVTEAVVEERLVFASDTPYAPS